MNQRLAPQLDRLDRHVGRSYLRISEGVSRYRVTNTLEEALRLVVLPGEEEGRVYYFRRIALTGIPAQGSRQLWMDKLQQALSEAAARAVHGGYGMDLTDAVYFHNREEALEVLLRDALRAGSGETPKWLVVSVLGIEPQASYAHIIPIILDCLRQLPLSPGVGAAIIFAALGNSNPVALLEAVPLHLATEWVREFDTHGRVFGEAPPPIQLSSPIVVTLQNAADYCGWKDPRTIWLAAMAVIHASPYALSSGSVMERTRATLRLLEMEHPRRPSEQLRQTNASDAVSAMNSGTSSHALIFDDDDVSTMRSENFTATPTLLGEPTSSAGLYFLLHVLRRLGITTAIDACPALREAGFVEHILKQLATNSGVEDDDPILSCLHPERAEFSLPPETLTSLSPDVEDWPAVWPTNLSARRHTSFGSRLLLRTWTVAVRLWCWRTGRISVRDVVNRKGHVWLTRTDLDVTMPLASVSVLIRRIGLDIDPGWLPWFGDFGRVVRFHYRDDMPGGPSC
jgi:hypothetical protein